MANERAATTVTVACKLPHGLHLDLPQRGDRPHKRVTVKGCNARDSVAFGYGITEGVPKDHWDEWLSMHKDMVMVKNQLIFAHVQSASVTDMAKENAKRKTGLEGIDPEKPGEKITTMKED